MVGERFARLTVLESLPKRRGSTRWRCRCDCGTIKAVDQTHLRSGATQSCGCFSRELAKSRTTHGASVDYTLTPEYTSWKGMKQRCLNPRNPSYERYGAKGITICARWRDDFDAFRSDMGPRPDGTSLDRIDNAGPYAPENCRWADDKTQARGSITERLTKPCEHCGQNMTVMFKERDRKYCSRRCYHAASKGRERIRARRSDTTASRQPPTSAGETSSMPR